MKKQVLIKPKKHAGVNISLRYFELTQEQGINAKILGEAIIAFSEYSKHIISVTDAEDAIITVSGLEKGSVIIQFFWELSDITAMIAPFASDVDTLIQLIKNTIKYTQFLKGSPPIKTQSITGGDIKVQNNDGDTYIVNQNIHKLVVNLNITEKAEKVFRMPLIDEAGKASIFVDGQKAIEVNRKESQNIRKLKESDTVLETVTEMYLTIVKLALEGKSKWSFTDGNRAFTAKIEDLNFLERVISGRESFAHGDMLLVKVISTQKHDKGKLKTDYTIVEVLKHTRGEASSSIDLFDSTL